MIDTNYSIEAFNYLLDKECVSARYYPLIPFKNELIARTQTQGYKTKNELAMLPDSKLKELGLPDEALIRLFRRFLMIYDPNPGKFKEIEKLNLAENKHLAFQQLYYLPGVKQVRASLYYYAGYHSLKEIAESNVEEILKKTALAISLNNLSCIVPLPKEVRTHIALARAFTQNK